MAFERGKFSGGIDAAIKPPTSAFDGGPERIDIVATANGQSIWKVKTSGGAERYSPHLSGGLYPTIEAAKAATEKK